MLLELWERFSLRRRVGLALGPLLFAALGGALAAAGLPGRAAWAGATVLLMAVWWITEPVPLWATALLPLALFPAVGAAPFSEVLLQYFDPVNFLFLGGMWIAACMEQWGLHRRLALGIVARIGASPRRIVLGFMVATAFLSLWISNTASALMMCPIGMAVLQRFSEQRGGDDPGLRRFGLALMLGIAYAASMGGIGSKIGTGTNLVFVKEAHRALGLEVSFVTWFKIGLPVVMVALPAAWLYLVRVAARVPSEEFVGGRQAIAEARAKLGRMSRGEKAAMAGFLSAASLWVFRQELDFGLFRVPGWGQTVPWTWSDILGRPVQELPPPISELLGARGSEAVVALLVAVALLLLPVSVRPLRSALSLGQAGRISWGLLALLGGGFAMAHGISESGLSQVLGGVLGGIGPVHPFLALVAVCLATTALSEVASNTATASILLPLLAVSASSFGLDPAILMFAATLSASFGFMLPAGTPPNAVVFSSGYVKVTQMARSGLVVDLGGALLIAVLAYFIVPLTLGLGR
jgi:solute carrier family 13 (sodium-dependent dicarboxylate transporter), member 2/3/5